MCKISADSVLIMEWVLILVLLKLDVANMYNNQQLLSQTTNCGMPFEDNKSVCPLWTRQGTEGESNTCNCGDTLHGVVLCDCKSLEISLLPCFCMSASETANKTVVGYCIFTCMDVGHYMKVETNKSGLNEYVCNSHKNFSRTGQMCGKCKEGYAPPVYSYSLACVECSDYKYNWLKYIAIAFLPVTVFYIIVIVFRVTVTSSAMIGYVLCNQLIAVPTQFHIISIIRSYRNGPGSLDIHFKIISLLYGIWNLDFLRGVFEPFCLHPKVSFLQTLLLDYSLAVYPMFLIFMTYLLVILHDSTTTIRWLWRPFFKCCIRMRREWNIQSSLVSAFATFILLSYVKILDVTFQILTPTRLYDVSGDQLPQLYLYYNGTVEYFGKEHLPYAVLALFMFTVFNMFPLLLLCLYPCQCFQRCLNCCNIGWPSLHIFMDTFYGCYKLKPYDCRYFAAFYLALRIINYGVLILSTSVLYSPIITVIFAIAAIVTALARPYRKHQFFTIVDVVLLVCLTLISACLNVYLCKRAMDPIPVFHGMTPLPILVWIPPLYGFSLLIYSVIPKRVLAKGKNVFMKIYQKFSFQCRFKCYTYEYQDWSESEPMLEYCTVVETDEGLSQLIHDQVPTTAVGINL